MAGTKRGLLISLEMSDEIVGERLIAQRLGTSLSNLNTGFLSKAEMTRIFPPVTCKDCGCTELSQVVDYKKFFVENTCMGMIVGF